MYNKYKNILEQKSQLKNIIYNNGKKLIYQKDEKILSDGDTVQEIYYLDKGRVKYSKLCENGTTQIFSIKNSDILIGVIPILSGNNIQKNDVISDTTSEIYVINLDTFFSLIDSSLIFKYYVLNNISSSMLSVSNKKISSRLYPNKDILYSYLVENTNYDQLIEDCWYDVYPQHSQQEYAELLGVTRMTVFTIIKSLCEEEKIRLINRKIQVKICNEDSDSQ